LVYMAQMTRQIDTETSLIVDDATTHSMPSTNYPCGGTQNLGTIIQTIDGLVPFHFHEVNTVPAYLRLKCGGTVVWAGSYGASIGEVISGMFHNEKGTHIMTMEGDQSAGAATISDWRIGQTSFVDFAGLSIGSAVGAVGTLGTFTIPTRETPLGPLNMGVFYVSVCGYTQATAAPGTTPGSCVYNNVGDTHVNGIALYINGAQTNWTGKFDDKVNRLVSRGWYWGTYPVGSALIVGILKPSAPLDRDGNAATCYTSMSIMYCPWLLHPTVYSPFCNFGSYPNRSTVYAHAEVLSEIYESGWGAGHASNADQSVFYLAIGKSPRALTYGGTIPDFYTTTNGTTNFALSYTVEEFDSNCLRFYGKGLGGCISAVAVDVM